MIDRLTANLTRSLTACLVLLTAAAGHAQTVTYTLSVDDAGPGTFSVFAAASAGDNAGIALYGVPLTGDILGVDHRSLAGLGLNGVDAPADAGFTEFRSADGVASLAGSQQLVPTATPYLYFGIGQTAGDSLASPSNGPLAAFISTDLTQDASFEAVFRIATGTWNPLGSAPGFNSASPDLLANVFTGSGVATRAAAVVTRVVPEPATALMVLTLGLIAARRRRSVA